MNTGLLHMYGTSAMTVTVSFLEVYTGFLTDDVVAADLTCNI